MKYDNYAHFMDIFGILRWETKYLEGILVLVFDIAMDTNFFTTRFSNVKFNKVFELATSMLNKKSLTLLEK